MPPQSIDQETLRLARIVWDYHRVGHALERADCILALGSHDIRVAEWAAQLYLDGYAPLIIYSGGLGNLTLGKWERPEARIFADVAYAKGVPRRAVIIEDRSTNTGENLLFTKRLLAEKGIDPQKFILVQKPYMERRALATFLIHLPDKKIVVTSPQIDLEQYPTAEISLRDVINIMVGDLPRLRIYPEKGYMAYQEIPPEVWDAYQSLVARGFTKHLLSENQC